MGTEGHEKWHVSPCKLSTMWELAVARNVSKRKARARADIKCMCECDFDSTRKQESCTINTNLSNKQFGKKRALRKFAAHH